MRNRDMLVSTPLTVSQYKLLIFAVPAAAASPLIASELNLPLSVVLSGILCALVWAQEIFIIQIKYKSQNIEFTRRFRDRYSGFESIIYGFMPHIISLLIVGYIMSEIGGMPSTNGWLVLIFSFLILVRIFDPLLGCISTHEPISWISMGGYVVVFSFATSTAIDPSKLEFYPFPFLLMESILIALITFTILNLRMAYYQKYCFGEDQSLESQLKYVLIPILLLSIHQIVTIVDSIDISAILKR